MGKLMDKVREMIEPEDDSPGLEQQPLFKLDVGADGGTFEGYSATGDGKSDTNVWDEFWTLTGLDKNTYRIVDDSVKVSMWQSGGEWQKSFRGEFVRITERDLETDDLAQMMAIAHGNASASTSGASGDVDGTVVFVLSDVQIGKVDKLGGTKELIERVVELTDRAVRYATAHGGRKALILDPGDLTEGFENTAQQRFTNDLSHPAQLRVARAILTDFVTTVASVFDEVQVATCPSNHGAWRKGKDYLGRPGDDYGIDVHLSVRDILSRDDRYAHVTWINSEDDSVWSPVTQVPVEGKTLLLTHGDMSNSADKVVDWWKMQSFDHTYARDAFALVTGHWHHVRTHQTGVLDDGTPRWWIQAPTMDNGSSWWENKSGDTSAPGILLFTVTENGIDHFKLIS